VESHKRVLDYDLMLYPQYEYYYDKVIPLGFWEWMRKDAQRLLDEAPDATPKVRTHWQSIVDGVVPFGYKIKEIMP